MTFKVHVEPNGSIHKLRVPLDGNFQSSLAKIQDCLLREDQDSGVSPSSVLSNYWRYDDLDGDRITVSSQEDLKEMFNDQVKTSKRNDRKKSEMFSKTKYRW